MTIEAAADGSSLGNPGPTGWGWYVDDEHWAAGGWPTGTNNKGELMALLDLLRQSADIPENLRVYCDSKYVIDAATTWIGGWKRRGWRKADGTPVLNVELIQAIDELILARRAAGYPVELVWVKGHAGHPLNERADKLANGAAAAYQAGTVPAPGPGFDMSRTPVTPARAPGLVQPDLFALPEELEPVDEDLVVDLERSLLTTAVRTSPSALAALLHPDWCEFGSSGTVLDRESAIAGLAPVEVDLELVEVSRLAPDLILVLWRAVGAGTTSLRSSIWVRSAGGWRQRFHHGTRCD